MTDADVLVVGGGLAGSVAALAAARRRPDADVAVATQTETPFAAETGLVDVLGRPPDGGTTVVDPTESIPDLPEDHPYRVLGTDTLVAGLDLFDDATSESYCGGSTDANALVPTFHGRVTPAARYPAAVAPGLASREVHTLLVGFERLPDLSAPLAASRLRTAGVPFDVAGLQISLPVSTAESTTPLDLARTFDEDPEIDGLPFRERVADRVGAQLEGADRVGFPAVLGRTEIAEVHATLSADVGVDVFEVPLVGPHVPGLRLGDALDGSLAAAGVEPTGAVVDGRAENGDSIEVVLAGEDGPQTVRPSAVVLATGGLARGGIVADRAAVREPLFGCRIPHPKGRADWADRDPDRDHAFARFGVRIDGDARPLDADGEPEHEALFAAGRIVGGHDAAGEGSIAGVSITTGYVAGRRAAEAVGK